MYHAGVGCGGLHFNLSIRQAIFGDSIGSPLLAWRHCLHYFGHHCLSSSRYSTWDICTSQGFRIQFFVPKTEIHVGTCALRHVSLLIHVAVFHQNMCVLLPGKKILCRVVKKNLFGAVAEPHPVS